MINDRIFTDGFRFNIFNYKKYKRNDLRGGVKLHFIALMISGKASIVTENEVIDISEGDVFYIPKGLKYESYWHGSPNIEFASLGFEFIPTFSGDGYPTQTVDTDAKIKSKILDLARSGAHSPEDVGALYSIFGTLACNMQTTKATKQSELVMKVKKYISAHPLENVSEVAKHFTVSESGLYLAFKNYSEQTISEYRSQSLLETARGMLVSTDTPIAMISDTLGFSSDSYFRKKFKAHFGISAREMRKRACM